MVPVGPAASPDRLLSLLSRFDPPTGNPARPAAIHKRLLKVIQYPLFRFKVMLPRLPVDELALTRIAFFIDPIRCAPADAIEPLLKKIAWTLDNIRFFPLAKTTRVFDQLIPVETPRRILSTTIPLEDFPQG